MLKSKDVTTEIINKYKYKESEKDTTQSELAEVVDLVEDYDGRSKLCKNVYKVSGTKDTCKAMFSRKNISYYAYFKTYDEITLKELGIIAEKWVTTHSMWYEIEFYEPPFRIKPINENIFIHQILLTKDNDHYVSFSFNLRKFKETENLNKCMFVTNSSVRIKLSFLKEHNNFQKIIEQTILDFKKDFLKVKKLEDLAKIYKKIRFIIRMEKTLVKTNVTILHKKSYVVVTIPKIKNILPATMQFTVSFNEIISIAEASKAVIEKRRRWLLPNKDELIEVFIDQVNKGLQ